VAVSPFLVVASAPACLRDRTRWPAHRHATDPPGSSRRITHVDHPPSASPVCAVMRDQILGRVEERSRSKNGKEKGDRPDRWRSRRSSEGTRSSIQFVEQQPD